MVGLWTRLVWKKATSLSNQTARLRIRQPCSSEQGMGRWVMGHGSNGSRKSDGPHGSWVTRCWPMTHQFFKTLWLVLYIVAMIIYRVSLWCMCNCACDWRSSKFTFTFKLMLVGLPRYPGDNYPGNFLLPDGYPGSEYLICRIYLIGFSELVQ